MTLMRAYEIHDPVLVRRGMGYAQPGVRGTWPQGTKACPECKGGTSQLTEPLVIEWEAGSDVIGDFSWPGGSRIVVSSNARSIFEKHAVEGVDYRPIRMIQNPKLRKPVRITKRTKPRVWLPYEGPSLWQLMITKTALLDEGNSKIRVRWQCSTCRRTRYDRYGKDRGELTFLIDNDNPAFFFRLDTSVYPDAVWDLCSDGVRELIEQEGLTNAVLTDAGEILRSLAEKTGTRSK